MELLSPKVDPFSGFSHPAAFQLPFDGSSRAAAASSPLPGIVEESEDIVHVAVGKSVGKAVALLRWAFGQFGNREICILHVHQPSHFVPTLLGKLPASQANSYVVSAFRREEREEMRALLSNYLSLCSRSKVKASIITTEAEQVHKGVVDLVKEYNIRRLVIGAIPENCIKVKKGSRKASYAAKNAPLFCEIWFVNKGKLVWKRDATEGPSSMPPINSQDSIANLGSCAVHSYSDEAIPSQDWVQAEETEVVVSPAPPGRPKKFDADCFHSLSSTRSISSGSGYSSSAEQRASESDEESLYSRLTEVRTDVEASENEAIAELSKRKNFESLALEAISKVRAFESAYLQEVKLRKEAEDTLQTMLPEQQKLVQENEKITRELHMTMRSIALLDSSGQEANRRYEEASEELRHLHASIATLRQEKQKIQLQKIKATRWVDLWRNHKEVGSTNFVEFAGCSGTSAEFTEFSMIDLQVATCEFSESFKIGQGEYGVVYKGEILERTVAIKMLHPHNMHGQLEFHQEVEFLGKLKHPHLVNLIGACQEAWSLVYEYIPNGSLHNHLLHRKSTFHLKWKIRSRIIAEIANALLFLHSSVPEKIVHGSLKPQNILLDSDLSCKISDFGILRLVPEHPLRCPSFRYYTEPNGAFSYRDPEFHRTRALSPKSDLYSFGLIILQLLTGRTPIGLASEVRKAVSCGTLISILDSSAGEWPTFVARRLVDLGLQCCELKSRDRPTLTPILVNELEQLHVLEERAVPSFFLCPILKEIMHDPQIAADGFTYEGEAMRGWLENGRETSPMTNLRLSHLHLIPNHALRQAIQDWICKS